MRLSDSSFSLTNRLSEASDTTFTVVNGIADPPNVASVISTSELSRSSQITAVPVQADKVSTDPSNMHNNLKKVQASAASAASAAPSSNATSNATSPNDLNHNGLTKQEGNMEKAAAMVKLEEQ